MKQLSFLKLSLVFLLAFTMIQCNKDEDGDGVNNPNGGDCMISWTLDGQSDEHEPSACIYLDFTLNLGIFNQDKAFLQINNLMETGTFDLADVSVQFAVDMGNGVQLASESGTVTVTELTSNKAKGTFTATMRDVTDVFLTGPTYEVTAGSFESSF